MASCNINGRNQYNINTISIQYQYNINTISIQYPYNINTISIQYQYNINTIPIQYQYNIKQTSDRNKQKYQLWDWYLIQYHPLGTSIVSIVWRAVRRITNEILGVKGLSNCEVTFRIQYYPGFVAFFSKTLRLESYCWPLDASWSPT